MAENITDTQPIKNPQFPRMQRFWWLKIMLQTLY